jgi:hypothetical protein
MFGKGRRVVALSTYGYRFCGGKRRLVVTVKRKKWKN